MAYYMVIMSLLHLFWFCVVIRLQSLCTVFLNHIHHIVRSVECCANGTLQYVLVNMVAVAHESAVVDSVGTSDMLSATDCLYMSA